MWAIVTSTIRVGDPSPDLITYCEKELTLANPDYIKRQRMGLWLGKTPQTVRLYETDGAELILPHGCLSVISAMTSAILYDYAANDPVDYKGDVELYDYQRDAVNTLLLAGNGILQSPAGSGKTQMGIALIVALSGKALWVTHTKDLLRQSKERAEQYIDPSLIGTITEGQVKIGSGVTFATVQTLANIDLQRYRNTWDVIIVDECHRVSGSPTKVTQFSKVLNSLSARHKFGLSATVHRSDGLVKATHALLGPIVYSVPADAVSSRVMSVSIQPRLTGIRESLECLNTDGTINYAGLIAYLAHSYPRDLIIVKDLFANREHSCLILSDRLTQLQGLIDMLPWYMRDKAVMISGTMRNKADKVLRDNAINDMRSGKKKFLFATYSLAREGLDIPCLDRLFLVTPHHDYAVITQSIGRIARRCEGKDSAIAYDYIDNIPFCINNYKKRKTTYRKNGCVFLEETS